MKIKSNHKQNLKVYKMSTIRSLKIAMAQRELSQKELAEISGVSETTISHTLSGKTTPNTKTIAKLAKAMVISYSELIKLGE